MMNSTSPSAIVRSIPRSTSLSPKALWMPRNSIIGSLARDQDRTRRRAHDALGDAAEQGAVVAAAAAQRDQVGAALAQASADRLGRRTLELGEADLDVVGPDLA